jgi:hypothetical protein
VECVGLGIFFSLFGRRHEYWCSVCVWLLVCAVGGGGSGSTVLACMLISRYSCAEKRKTLIMTIIVELNKFNSILIVLEMSIISLQACTLSDRKVLAARIIHVDVTILN